MRPMRPVLALLALLLVPAALLAGKGPPPPPAGEFFFVDQKSFDKIQSLANIDQTFDEFCLSGSVVFIDQTTVPNTRVEFAFSSLGDIAKETSEKIDGDFTVNPISLTLTMFDGPVDTDPVLVGPTTIVPTPPCKLEGTLKKGGDADRVVLSCETGPNLEQFNIPASVPDPFPTQKGDVITQEELLDSITFATAKKKTIKVDVKKGTIRINHIGVPDPNAADSDLVCPTSSDIE